MKRIFAIILSTVLLLGALVACGTTPAETTPTPTTPAPTTPAPTTPVVTTPVSTTPTPTTPAPTLPPAPPYVIIFHSIDEIRELKSMLDEDDTTAEAYLKSKDYLVGDLRSKDDVRHFFETYGDLNILLLDPSLQLDLTIKYIPIYDLVEISYYAKGVFITNYINHGTISDVEDTAFTMSIGDQTVDFIRGITALHFWARFPFEGGVMSIIIRETDADLVKSTFDGNFIITTLNELIEK